MSQPVHSRVSFVRVLIAPDKFKGSLSSAEAARAIAAGWRSAWPECTLELAPIADGGEGFADALLHALGGEWIHARAHDALGRPINARYAWMPRSRRAVIEMSEASGLWRLPQDERDPLRAETFGTGELMRHAVELGAEEIYVGLGGSATTDGGAGMAVALGCELLDKHDCALTPQPQNLPFVHRISRARVPALPRITAACDVENPLLGPRGTAQVFAPQKGAAPATVVLLESALTHFSNVVQRELQSDFRETPGAGAAGGLGFGLLSFANAAVRSGFDIVSEALDLPGRVGECDLVITGEGRIDHQTLEGKGPAGVAALARKAGVPVLAFGGCLEGEPALADCFDGLCPIVSGPISLVEAMARGAELLER
ncbi:MAG TPA: glycerate kinase, partial [Chthoniobacteraceae bacterium]|nr:glycerate kinase [Chthoniobacteraceae bacterium]